MNHKKFRRLIKSRIIITKSWRSVSGKNQSSSHLQLASSACVRLHNRTSVSCSPELDTSELLGN